MTVKSSYPSKNITRWGFTDPAQIRDNPGVLDLITYKTPVTPDLPPVRGRLPNLENVEKCFLSVRASVTSVMSL